MGMKEKFLKLAELAGAVEEGKKLEVKNPDGTWFTSDSPLYWMSEASADAFPIGRLRIKKELGVVYINEYKDGKCGSVWRHEAEAKLWARRDALRVAVKYVEAEEQE